MVYKRILRMFGHHPFNRWIILWTTIDPRHEIRQTIRLHESIYRFPRMARQDIGCCKHLSVTRRNDFKSLNRSIIVFRNRNPSWVEKLSKKSFIKQMQFFNSNIHCFNNNRLMGNIITFSSYNKTKMIIIMIDDTWLKVQKLLIS